MAYDNRTRVYLGYEDEYVTDKHRSMLNFTTNKIGGYPNCYGKSTLTSPQCRLCGLYQLLALQLYAPLDNSKYHRTLYIFACINPNCWNQNESWTCLRIQSLEDETREDLSDSGKVNVPSTTSWLSEADDWGENMNDNASEQNGNDMLENDALQCNFSFHRGIEQDIREELAVLHMDDPNANSPTSVDSPVSGGAVGRLDSPQASAEIDGDENEVVCIDTPTRPQCDLISLLHEVTPLPLQLTSADTKYSFLETFLSVDEEDYNTDVTQHVRDLLLEYQHSNPDASTKFMPESGNPKTIETDLEKYEKSIPMHGDEMYHNFICRIQKNSGQLLRYSRNNSAPLLLYPLSGCCIGKCRHCGDEMTFELQILPTIIPKLILYPRTERNFQIEFGTVLIYTCVRSCWSVTDSYREEYVIVQAERL